MIGPASSTSDVTQPVTEAALSPAVPGARPPGEAPQPFCERCGTSVEVATIGPWVGLCHCPSCDTYSCRWCWSEAGEACPECEAWFGETPAAAPATEALVASTSTTDALAAGTLAANALVAEQLAREETPVRPRAAEAPAAAAAAIHLNAKRVPVGVGVAVLAVAVFALILGNGFGGGGLGSAVGATSSPGGSSSAGAGAGARGPGSETDPTSASSIDPPVAATEDTAPPAGGANPSPRQTATATASRPGASPTPTTPGLTPGPTPTTTPHITAAPTPPPTPSPAPTPTPAPTPPPACKVVPDLVGLTVSKARGAWRGAGFTGAFTAPSGGGNQTVATQNQPKGTCLPPDTSITVTT